MKPRKRPAGEAVAQVLLEQLATIRAAAPAVLAADDAEALHDLRVAVRKTRAVLKGFADVFTPAAHDRFADQLRELQALTGPPRDLDVLVERVDAFAAERPELGPETAQLRRALMRRRSRERVRLRRRLRSKRFANLLDDWEHELTRMSDRVETQPPTALEAIGPLAASRIAIDYRRMEKASRAAIESGEPELIHRARKRGKNLRYNLEFFGRLVDRDVTDALIADLRRAQDELGSYQDTVAREALLRESATEGPSQLAAGALLERAFVERAAAHAAFARRFGKLTAKKRRSEVRRAFGQAAGGPSTDAQR